MPDDGEVSEESPQEIRYLTAEHILILHEAVLEPHEDPTILEDNLVRSLAVRPQTRYFGEEQFPGLMLKAAVMLHGLASAQFFVTGNKRTAWEVTRVFLGWNGWRVAQVTSAGEYHARKESIGRLLDQIGGQELTDLSQIKHRLLYYFEPGRPAKGRYRQGQVLNTSVQTSSEEVATMKCMDDTEFPGTAAGGPRFQAGPSDSGVGSRPASVAPFWVAAALGKVADPELREIMGIVLEEDADLITYLRDR